MIQGACESACSDTIDRKPQQTILGQVKGYLSGTLVVAEMEVRRLRHDPTELLTRAIQPALWLIVFGSAFSRIRSLPTGHIAYRTFLTPGILSQSMMFISIFYGLSMIWDRDQGILQKLLTMPVPRSSVIAGKALSAGVRALAQVVIILLLALVLGIHLVWSVPAITFSILVVLFGAVFFSSLSMVFAAIVKTREMFMGLSQVITMPLFFASSALYPINIMPSWLKVVARMNPLSYVVDLLRGYLATGKVVDAPMDWLVLIVATVLVQMIASRLCRRVVI